MLKISVFGSGGWGTALAQLCASKGYKVVQWVREAEVAEAINTGNKNASGVCFDFGTNHERARRLC